MADLQLTAVLYALSDDTRLQIVRKLALTEEVACGNFLNVKVAKSSLSHHFRVLRTSGVITTRKEGAALLNRLRARDLEERFPGLLASVLASIGARGKPFVGRSIKALQTSKLVTA